mmetsp:Transcript_12963/g.31778  ORF Transcript_12963/g.31778 Transcript_12963/m.31778 type:complete len:104 (+) Transcript_12963:483-794(+)
MHQWRQRRNFQKAGLYISILKLEGNITIIKKRDNHRGAFPRWKIKRTYSFRLDGRNTSTVKELRTFTMQQQVNQSGRSLRSDNSRIQARVRQVYQQNKIPACF